MPFALSFAMKKTLALALVSLVFFAACQSGIFTWQLILAVGVMNYLYKFFMALILTPVIYLVEKRIEKYVGYETAKQMKQAAMGGGKEVNKQQGMNNGE